MMQLAPSCGRDGADCGPVITRVALCCQLPSVPLPDLGFPLVVKPCVPFLGDHHASPSLTRITTWQEPLEPLLTRPGFMFGQLTCPPGMFPFSELGFGTHKGGRSLTRNNM